MLGQFLLNTNDDEAALEALLDDLERLPARRMPMEIPILRWLAEHADARGERLRARALAAEAVRRSAAFLEADHPEVAASRQLAAALQPDASD
jgi:hypothetical protein